MTVLASRHYAPRPPAPQYHWGADYDAIAPEQSASRVARDVWAATIIRERAGTVADDWRWDGSKVRVILTPQQDLNGRFVESLVANATAGVVSEPHVPTNPVDVTPAEHRIARINEIQANLGLPMRTLAAVLNISRPQLYKWLDAKAPVQPHSESVERVNAIARLARLWGTRTTAPLAPWLHEQIGDGRPLYTLLTQDDLPVAEIERSFEAIVARIGQGPKTRSQRMRDAGFARRPSRHALPSDE